MTASTKDLIEEARHRASCNAGFEDGDAFTQLADALERFSAAQQAFYEPNARLSAEVSRLTAELAEARQQGIDAASAIATENRRLRHALMDAERSARPVPAAQAVPEGWQLVPIEPTSEMWAAVNKLDDEMAAGGYDGKGCSIEQAWNCMLAAAPQQPDAQNDDALLFAAEAQRSAK